ncbi:hypothetical protein [Nocardiopsis sp. CC223A]|uniref:hypothetical protein n=1 Tax=Nocardiopsis sp. CC223A TaxID=3044051 RepID=UPI00278C4C2C|nr:hypothetical protein [Nocardiopsis sp. CC223A]
MPKPRITADKISRSPEWEAELARQGLRPAPGTGRGAARLRGAALRRHAPDDVRYTADRQREDDRA